MQFEKAFLFALLLVKAAGAQTADDELRSKILSVRYPPLAEQARVQGVVHLSSRSGMLTMISGHSVFAQTAVASAKSVASIRGEANFELTYHFVLADIAPTTVVTTRTVQRGNAFERVVLRMFGRKTEKVIREEQCQAGVPPPNDLKISGANIEVWIYGRTFCVEVNAATLVAVAGHLPQVSGN